MFGFFFFIRRGDSTIIRACAKVVAVAHNSGGGWEYKLCNILKSAEVKKLNEGKPGYHVRVMIQGSLAEVFAYKTL